MLEAQIRTLNHIPSHTSRYVCVSVECVCLCFDGVLICHRQLPLFHVTIYLNLFACLSALFASAHSCFITDFIVVVSSMWYLVFFFSI